MHAKLQLLHQLQHMCHVQHLCVYGELTQAQGKSSLGNLVALTVVLDAVFHRSGKEFQRHWHVVYIGFDQSVEKQVPYKCGVSPVVVCTQPIIP